MILKIHHRMIKRLGIRRRVKAVFPKARDLKPKEMMIPKTIRKKWEFLIKNRSVLSKNAKTCNAKN